MLTKMNLCFFNEWMMHWYDTIMTGMNQILLGCVQYCLNWTNRIVLVFFFFFIHAYFFVLMFPGRLISNERRQRRSIRISRPNSHRFSKFYAQTNLLENKNNKHDVLCNTSKHFADINQMIISRWFSRFTQHKWSKEKN